MLAVLQFSEDDDMAFTLDRMFTRINPMRARLASGRCFLRFVVIEDQAQRRSICAALNQWMLSSAEKATGIRARLPVVAGTGRCGRVGTARVGRTLLSDSMPTRHHVCAADPVKNEFDINRPRISIPEPTRIFTVLTPSPPASSRGIGG